MKKVTILAAAFALIGFTSLTANAQTTAPQQTQQAQQQEEKKEKVTLEQAPEGVQTALKSDTYKDWTVSEIYKVTPAAPDAKPVYEVTLTNAAGQKGAVRMTEEGGDASKAE